MDNDGLLVELTHAELVEAFNELLRLERQICANLAIRIGNERHDLALDPQEDGSDITGEKIAEAILARNEVH